MKAKTIIFTIIGIILIEAIFILGIAIATPDQDEPEKPEKKKERQEKTYIIERVIDGDTIELENGKEVRYIGIDTPETKHPNKEVECYGKKATEKNKELVEGKEIKMKKVISETDQYGRLLRYVWIEDTFVNDYLVKQGFAKASTYPPDTKYAEQFKKAQRQAREKERGLWEKCEREQ